MMTKSYFTELAKYNIWANNIVITWLQNISEEQWLHQIESSFKSIAATCTHIAGAEKVWCERWQQKNNIVFLANEFNGSKEDLINIWQTASTDILSFIEQADEQLFTQPFTFTRLNGETNTMLYYHAIAHVINHSSYHRGQLVTMLRQVGFTDISSTDMLSYFPH